MEKETPPSLKIKSRGCFSTVRRIFALLARYGIKAAKIQKNVSMYLQTVPKPTFFITGKILEKHTGILIGDAEYSVHGYYHLDHCELDADQLKIQLKKAQSLFRSFGIEDAGFRAPYLKINRKTLGIVKKAGFLYDSSLPVHWDVIEPGRMNRDYRQALKFYRPENAEELPCLPFVDEGILRIPVSLPDDEMLIDRLHIREPDALYQIWEKILLRCWEKNELFVVQLHPERFRLAGRAVGRLVRKAEAMKMWQAGLREIALWWKTNPGKHRWPGGQKGAISITGDIDRITWSDFFLSQRSGEKASLARARKSEG